MAKQFFIIAEGHQDHFLCGPNFTIADITMAITFERLKSVGLLKRFVQDGSHPLVEKYYERIRQRPSVQLACVQAYSAGQP